MDTAATACEEDAGSGVCQQKDGFFGMIHDSVGEARLIVGDQCDNVFAGISLAVTTTNSCQAIPGPNLMFVILPRGNWLRTVAPYSMPGSVISSTYCACPVTCSYPSLRGTENADDALTTHRMNYRTPV